MHALARDRMLEAQLCRMQCLAVERLERHLRSFGQFPDRGLEAFAIGLIAKERMADMGHMHADLVSAAGLQPAADEARIGWGAEILLNLIMRHRLARPRTMGDAHLLARR